MPRIAQSQNPDMTRYTQANAAAVPAATSVPPALAADSPSPFMRCPMPPISRSADGLRQFYRSGIPQTRMIPPQGTL